MLHLDTAASLTNLWKTLLRGDAATISRSELRAVARQACAYALSDAVHIERLIIEVKRHWAMHHDGATVQDVETWSDKRLRAEGVVSELVSLMIEEYYRRPSDSLPSDHRGKRLSIRENPE
jgi:hypothetical protein